MLANHQSNETAAVFKPSVFTRHSPIKPAVASAHALPPSCNVDDDLWHGMERKISHLHAKSFSGLHVATVQQSNLSAYTVAQINMLQQKICKILAIVRNIKILYHEPHCRLPTFQYDDMHSFFHTRSIRRHGKHIQHIISRRLPSASDVSRYTIHDTSDNRFVWCAAEPTQLPCRFIPRRDSQTCSPGNSDRNYP